MTALSNAEGRALLLSKGKPTKTKPPAKAKASNLTGFVQPELDKVMDAISIGGKALQEFGPLEVSYYAETPEGENKITIRLEKIKLEIVLTVSKF